MTYGSIYKRFTCSSSSRRIRTLWILLLVSTRNKPFKSQYLIWIPLSSCYKILVNHESRIWCLLKRTSLGWWKYFFSSRFCQVMYWYYQENLHGNHFWGSELFVITLCMAKQGKQKHGVGLGCGGYCNSLRKVSTFHVSSFEQEI